MKKSLSISTEPLLSNVLLKPLTVVLINIILRQTRSEKKYFLTSSSIASVLCNPGMTPCSGSNLENGWRQRLRSTGLPIGNGTLGINYQTVT